VPVTASPPGHLKRFKPPNSLTTVLRTFPLSPLSAESPKELIVALLCLLECAARIRGLSKLRRSFRGPVQPKLRSSEVRASVHDRLRSTSFRPSSAIPETAARVCALSEASPKSIGSRQTLLQSLVPRGDLRDTPQHFTPPRTCC
jgi:hypothetical protein